MECHQCGRRVERGDRFCNGCGTSLEGVTDTTQLVAVVDDTDADEGAETAETAEVPEAAERIETVDLVDSTPVEDVRTELLPTVDGDVWDDEPAWAATGAQPTQSGSESSGAVEVADAGSVATGDLPATEPITEVWMDTVSAEPDATETTPYDFAEQEPVAVTGQIEQQPTATAQMPAVAPAPVARARFGFTLMLTIALLTGIVSLVALFANVVTITSDIRLVAGPDTPPEFRTGTWIVDDLADNLSIAGLVASVLMVVGGVASGFRWRWGSGLAGGAGLAIAGIAAVTVGLAQMPIDVAHTFARIPAEDPFVLTITRDLGYWLLIVAGALGVVLFFASVNDALGDRRPGLNPWIAALGALAFVVTAAGPLLPEDQALFSDNWYLVEGVGEAPALLLVGRLIQLGLFLIAGVVGFLSVRRWGLGLAAGAALPLLWLVLSTLLEFGDRPVGPGFRNPGAADMHVHGVTIIGASGVLAMLVLGLVGAYDQGIRERR